MNCLNHPLRQGVNTCCTCGGWLCEECSNERHGRNYCKSCLVSGSGGSVRHGGRIPNILLLLLFSGIPGANYMYMGLIKRGLFVLMSFFLCIYLGGIFNFFGFVTAGVVITSFFDGLRIRRRFIAGEPVSDDVDDLKAFFSAHKLPILGITALLIVMEMFQNAARWFHHGFSSVTILPANPHGFLAVAVIALGVYFLVKARKKKEPRDKEDNMN